MSENSVQPRRDIPYRQNEQGTPVFDTHSELYRWCQRRIEAGGLPKFIHSPDVLMSVYHLLVNLQLPVMPNLRYTCIINGAVGIFGPLPRALAQRTGELEECKIWWVNKSNEIQDRARPFGNSYDGAVCQVKRRGHDPFVWSFTTDDAQKAGLLGKSGPWQQYTSLMLAYRAQGYALRFVFADALQGALIAEVDEFDASAPAIIEHVAAPDNVTTPSAPQMLVAKKRKPGRKTNAERAAMAQARLAQQVPPQMPAVVPPEPATAPEGEGGLMADPIEG